MSLDNWRSFLAGSPHKVIVYSDHQNLLYWKEPHKISRRVAREVLRLSEYNIEIRHIKGTANGRADALSRRPDYDQGTEDNTNVTVLPEHLFARTTVTIEPQHRQDEERLKPWIDPHQLKQLEWHLVQRRTSGRHRRTTGKRKIIKHITIHQYMDTQASIGRRKSSNATTGGHNYVKMSKITYKDAQTVSATKSTIDQPRRL
jgi:hypothetical protein